jgi:deazaflavin-dependent oxidoreductase (nitroreductase family)
MRWRQASRRHSRQCLVATVTASSITQRAPPTVRAFGAMTGEVFDNPTGWVARHIRRYVESGGARGHTFNGNDALLLTTRGRRTGRLRRTALYYGRDGERYVLVATAARGGGDPSWYLNLLHNPAVVLQVRSEIFAAIATPATASERPRLWRLMVDVVPKYPVYEMRAGRDLAVVIVSRH